MLELLFLSFLMFIFAIFILLTKPNIIFVLFGLEIMLLAINANFILGSILLNDLWGWLISLILFSIAAIDTGLGLLIILNYYNLRYSIKRTFQFALKKA